MAAKVDITRKYPRCIATISAGFEKGDFLVREEKGQRVYFDFFEEAFNYIAAKGYSRMPKVEEGEWMDLMVSNKLSMLMHYALRWGVMRLHIIWGGMSANQEPRGAVNCGVCAF